jgi:hypothetical protein
VGVGALGRGRQVRGREIVVDGAREFLEGRGSAHDGGRRRESGPQKGVFVIRDGRGAVRLRLHGYFFCG